EEFEALVGLAGGAETGELAHGPQAAAVHAGVDAAGKRELPGGAEVRVGVEAVEALRGVERVHGDGADRGRRLLAEGGGAVLLLPAFARGGVRNGGHVRVPLCCAHTSLVDATPRSRSPISYNLPSTRSDSPRICSVVSSSAIRSSPTS